MSAKKYAKYLIEKMSVIHYMKLGGKNKESKGLPISMHDSQIKECSLIAAREIIKELKFCNDNHSFINKRIAHYLNVIEEIKKH